MTRESPSFIVTMAISLMTTGDDNDYHGNLLCGYVASPLGAGDDSTVSVNGDDAKCVFTVQLMPLKLHLPGANNNRFQCRSFVSFELSYTALIGGSLFLCHLLR